MKRRTQQDFFVLPVPRCCCGPSAVSRLIDLTPARRLSARRQRTNKEASFRSPAALKLMLTGRQIVSLRTDRPTDRRTDGDATAVQRLASVDEALAAETEWTMGGRRVTPERQRRPMFGWLIRQTAVRTTSVADQRDHPMSRRFANTSSKLLSAVSRVHDSTLMLKCLPGNYSASADAVAPRSKTKATQLSVRGAVLPTTGGQDGGLRGKHTAHVCRQRIYDVRFHLIVCEANRWKAVRSVTMRNSNEVFSFCSIVNVAQSASDNVNRCSSRACLRLWLSTSIMIVS